MFSRVRNMGLWTLASTVDAAEWEKFDANQSKALDMEGGGAYAPKADIAIGGDPGVVWTFELPVTVNNDVLIAGDNFECYADEIILGADGLDVLTINAGLTVNGLSSFENDVQFQTNVFFYDDVTFNDDVTIGAGHLLDVYGDALFHAGAEFQGSALFSFGATFSATATFDAGMKLGSDASDDIELRGILRCGGSGRIKQRQQVATDADETFSPTTAGHVYMPAGVMTSSRDATINDTGAVDGDRMRFTNLDTTTFWVIKRPGGVVLALLKANTGGGMPSCDVERIDGIWHVAPGGLLP